MGSRALHILPKQILSLPCLHSLDLSHNFLSTISLDLSPLSSVRRLRLSNNLMTSLPLHLANALPHLAHLTELDVSHNKLWYLEPFPQSVANTLTHLDVSHNSFSQVPAHLSNLSVLTTLKIAHNDFCDPNSAFPHPPPSPGTENENLLISHHFTQQQFNSKGEDTIPSVFTSLYSLTALDLSHNHATHLPPNFFDSLAKLERLDLSFNRIHKIPSGISRMRKLRSLSLSNNRGLRTFPEDFWELTGLQELYLRYTPPPTTTLVCLIVIAAGILHFVCLLIHSLYPSPNQYNNNNRSNCSLGSRSDELQPEIPSTTKTNPAKGTMLLSQLPFISQQISLASEALPSVAARKKNEVQPYVTLSSSPHFAILLSCLFVADDHPNAAFEPGWLIGTVALHPL